MQSIFACRLARFAGQQEVCIVSAKIRVYISATAKLICAHLKGVG